MTTYLPVEYSDIMRQHYDKYIAGCITDTDREQIKLKRFIRRFGNYYRHFCIKKVKSIKPLQNLQGNYTTDHFVDIRPKGNITTSFKEYIDDSNTEERQVFYTKMADVRSYTLIHSMFNGSDIAERGQGIFNIELSYNPLQVKLKHPTLKNIPFNGKRRFVRIITDNHDMYMVQDTDRCIYFFNPNGYSDTDSRNILFNAQQLIIDLFEEKEDGLYPQIYNCFPDFYIRVNGNLKKVFSNKFGLCSAITKYFSLIVTLNDTISMSNIIYYICCKFTYYFCKSADLDFKIFKQVLDEQFQEYDSKYPIHLDNIQFDIDIEKDIDSNKLVNTWTETIFTHYLFILETHIVFITSLLDWSRIDEDNYVNSLFPGFTELESNSVILNNSSMNDIYSQLYSNFEDCNASINKKQCIINNFKNGFLIGSLKYIGENSLYYFTTMIKNYLPQSYELLKLMGYEPEKDIPYIKIAEPSFYIFNKKLLELLLNVEIDMEKELFFLHI